MREHYPGQERERHYEQTDDVSQEVKKNLNEIESKSDEQHETDNRAKTEQLRVDIEKQARTAEEYQQNESEPDENEHSQVSHADLKQNAYATILTNTQAKLKNREKAFSKLVHKPVVETVSSVASKTVARPVGIVSGAAIACLGVSFSLLMAYRYGFSFNYLLFLLLFVGGYLAGTIIELLFKLATKRKLDNI